MAIKIVEPSDARQEAIAGKLFVYCDCEFTDKCPQGKKMGADRCVIRLEKRRLRRKEVARLLNDGR